LNPSSEETGRSSDVSRSLRLGAQKDQLAILQAFLEEHTAAHSVAKRARYDLTVAALEIVTNSIVHGYAGEPGWIDVVLWSDGADLCVQISDQAPPFDPTAVPAPDVSLPLDSRAPGGMGIHMARHYVDEMVYRPLPEGGNEILLIRRNAVSQGEP
jgi:serine/threonine-protein kinase RsbW